MRVVDTPRQDDPHRPAATVVVAVLTYRGIDATRACLKSLTRSAAWPIPVLVVDNASGTGEGVALATEFGMPVVSRMSFTNGGVPGGYNIALSWAADLGATHVLLLNNDTLLDDPELVHKLTRCAARGVAAVGPLVRGPDGALHSAGGRLRRWTGQAIHLLGASVPPGSAPYPVDWLDGSCLLVSMEAARSIGGLAPEYFLYWEEVDWCLRARQSGYRLLVDPTASITHLGSLTVSGNEQVAYWMRNKVLFVRRNCGWVANLIAIVTLLTIALPRHMARGVRSGRGWRPAAKAAANALRWNVADAREQRRWRMPAVGPSIGGGSRP
jgi:GT2 family glycosyltransferase